MDPKPIPAFYCCYLLRSTIRHASLYVGSTPNPLRRLAQHNGLAQGGARRTARINLRPWEMACIVAGFPSSIAALQFEWAWQNPHLTRRIASDDRLIVGEIITKFSTKSSRTRRRPARPRMSLSDKLANLHLLLRVPSFSRWPLQVNFFSEDVYAAWRKRCERAPADISASTKVVLDLKQPSELSPGEDRPLSSHAKGKERKGALGKGGLSGIDATYAPLKAHVEKSLFLLAEGEVVRCCVCAETLATPGGTTLVCSNQECRASSHLTCLSKKFLEQDESNSIIPVSGVCPSCNGRLQWVDLVKELTLRMRGETEVVKLMRKSRGKKPTGSTASKTLVPNQNTGDEDDDEDDDEEDDEDDDDEIYGTGNFMVHFEDDDDIVSVTSYASDSSVFSAKEGTTRPTFGVPKFEMIIEDSEWDSAEALD